MLQPALVLKSVTKEYYLEKPKTLKKWFQAFFSPFEKFTVLKNFSLTVNKGEFIVITGPNGSGKTTILKLIAKITEPDAGTIETHGRVVPVIELGAGFNHELSGRENILINATILGLNRKEIQRIESKIINFSGIEKFIDVPLKRYSIGMIARLALSIAIFSSPDILLLDEALAVGDRSFWKQSLVEIGRLRQKKVTIIWVSHMLDYFNIKIDRVIHLKKISY